MTTREELVAVARSWIGIPFRHQGRNRLGVDCGGLLLAVAEEAGLSTVPPGTYSMSPDPTLIAQALTDNCDAVPLSSVQPGDILHFTFAGEPRHVGLASDVGVIHAWAKPGKVVEHRLDEVWRKRLVAAYTPRGLE